MRLVVAIILSSFLIISFSKNLDSIYYENYWYPHYQGQRLSYCSFDGTECGINIASTYCNLLGFTKATHATISHNVGVANYLNSRAQCRGWNCNGFLVITCQGIMPSHKQTSYYRLNKFVHPRFDNFRIDWCYQDQKGCGKDAAHSFCRRMGYMQAKKYIKENVAATKTIGDHKLCFGENCFGFKEIVCFR